MNTLPIQLNEMKNYPNWVCFKFTEPNEAGKRGKVPYNALTGYGASSVNPSHWTTYENVIQATGYDGIGFVLSKDDPFVFIDLDDTKGNEAAFRIQQRIYKEFDSYTEYSPSGKGVHIIIKGSVPHGINKRRHNVEIYSDSRFMTITGNVLNNKPIENRHTLVNELWGQLGGQNRDAPHVEDYSPCKETDDEIINRLLMDKFTGKEFGKLASGDISAYHNDHSDADHAALRFLVKATPNDEQVRRIFRFLPLGYRKKAQRDNYLNYSIKNHRAEIANQIDFSGLLKTWNKGNR